MSTRYDIVVYGATGFTGVYVVRTLANISLFKEESLTNMARQAKVIINTVGPYILYGESVVRAAINNGANHVDISGEPAFIERIEQKYGKMARDKGVYIIGACGFDSIPSDLGFDFLKRHFDGTLAYVETCFRINRGSAGYSLNTATCESLLLGVKSMREGGEAALHRSLMPDPIPHPEYKPSCRFPLTKFREREFNAWALPFPAGDKSIIERSQYYDYHVNGKRPAQAYMYFSVGSFCTSILVSLWGAIFGFFALFGPTRRFISNHAEGLSFGMFKKAGPTTQQIKEASFDYYLFGTGWSQGENTDGVRPTKKVAAVCHGPDPGYMFTSAAISSVALALIDDRDRLPREGGVFTTASALRDTRVYEYLRAMGVSFELLKKEKTDLNQVV